jgi:BirA family biotin operon repressor/biotin-[acetyl-CoA-carboxylase] ligase
MSFTPGNIIILDSVDSTNNYAMALIQKREIAREIAVLAREQTHGKGRRGKQWLSNKDENIILSVAIPMQWLDVSRRFGISVAAALSCHDVLKDIVLANLFIKWPNDIFINDSKAGGILIENVIKGKIWQWTIIGIGLNINQEKFETENSATSLKIHTGKNFDVKNLAEKLYAQVLKRVEEIKEGNFKMMLKEYNSNLYACGKMVKLKKQNIMFETKIVGVSESGELLTKDSLERKFVFDEVEFRGIVPGQ